MRRLTSCAFLLVLPAVGIAFIFTLNFALQQMIAAFVTFLVGYVALMICLMICLVIAKGVYEGAKWVGAYGVRSASANRPISSDAETRAHREKRFVIPA
jgi:hypothetical protein